MGMLTTTASSDLSSGGGLREILREITNLEHIVLGMMGGLVAVTANASLVKPGQALVEAMIGASVTIVGFALLVHYKQRLDDPLGAIATHGFAGIAGVMCTAFFFRHDHYNTLRQIGVQALGCVIAAGIGCSLALVSCSLLWCIERIRRGSEWWFYGSMWRLTAYEQLISRTGTEFWVPAEDFERARRRVIASPPQPGGDKGWIDAVAVMVLSEKTDEELKELFPVLDRVLETSYRGSPEEQTALAAIGARADVSKLPMCVNRAIEHRDPKRPPGVLGWEELDPLYTETLIVTISELAKSFAADYRLLHVVESPSMIESFAKACILLKEIGEERVDREAVEKEPNRALARGRALVRSQARKNFLHLKNLPGYKDLMETYQRLSYQSA